MAEQFQFTIEHVVAVRDSLRAFHDELGPFISQYVQGPAPGSQAAQEMATDAERREHILTAISLGGFLIESAADHLMLFAKALDEPAQPMAPLTCARAAIEASAYATWFLDSSIDADERIARGLGRRHLGLDEMRKFWNSEKERHDNTSALDEILAYTMERIQHIEQLSQTLGIERARVPGPTAAVKVQLEKEPEYRMLSGVVHGHQWALHEAGFAVTSVSALGDPLAKKQIKPGFICTAGIKSQDALAQAAWCLVRLYGMDSAAFAMICDGFHRRSGLVPKEIPAWRKSNPS